MKLVNRLVRHFAIAFNTLVSVTFLTSLGFFSSVLTCICADQFPEQVLFFHHGSVIDLCCTLSTSKIFLIKHRCWVFSVDFILQVAHIF